MRWKKEPYRILTFEVWTFEKRGDSWTVQRAENPPRWAVVCQWKGGLCKPTIFFSTREEAVRYIFSEARIGPLAKLGMACEETPTWRDQETRRTGGSDGLEREAERQEQQ